MGTYLAAVLFMALLFLSTISREVFLKKSMDKKKKKEKLESLRESLQRLETGKTLAQGNKTQLDAIKRVEDRLLEEIAKLKALHTL